MLSHSLYIYVRSLAIVATAFVLLGCDNDMAFEKVSKASAPGAQSPGVTDPDSPSPPNDEDDSSPGAPPTYPEPTPPVDPPNGEEPGPGDPPDGEEPDPEDPDPQTEVQTFEQKAVGKKIDLLLVVDNSDSMMYEHWRHKVKQMLAGFLGTLQGVDYQIGVTTTDMQTTTSQPGWNGTLDYFEGSQQKILTPSTHQKESLLLETVDREEALECRNSQRDDGLPCGTNYEEPLKTLMTFVDKRNSENAGFFRDGADFVAVVISDEDEGSKGGNEATDPQVAKDYILNAFNNTKGFTTYGVVIEPGDTQCKEEQACQELFCAGGGEYGDFVTRLAQLTSGKTTSICQNNVSDDLRVIGESARTGTLFKEVTLQYEPLVGSVNVEISPATQIQYTVEGRTVKFDTPPPVGSIITVTYKH